MKNIISEALVINHDLRNNIGAAISHLQLLILNDPKLEKNKNILFAIENLNQSINISKNHSAKLHDSPESNSPESNLTTISCQNHLFKNAKPAYEKLKKMYSIKINDSYETIKEEKFVAANQAAISSLRENIINNAINSGATELDVSIEMKEYCLVVTFKDNGEGMTQEEVDKIHMKKHGDGTIHGLGTSSIINTIEEADGAYINFESKKNEGTRIRIIVPYTESY